MSLQPVLTDVNDAAQQAHYHIASATWEKALLATSTEIFASCTSELASHRVQRQLASSTEH